MRPATAAWLLVTLLAGAFLWWPVAVTVSLLTLAGLLWRDNRRINAHVAAVTADRDHWRTLARRESRARFAAERPDAVVLHGPWGDAS